MLLDTPSRERSTVRLRRRWTVADLAALPDALPSGPVRYELDNGELITMSPPGELHGAYELNLGAHLKIQGEWRGLGKARSGDVGIVLWRDPDRVVGADAVFVANTSLPIRRSPEGYLETIPDLVVEVMSPNDTRPEVQRKVDDYLHAGVRVVWVLDPARRTLAIHRPGQAVETLGEADTLTVPEVIPGFSLRVADALAE